MSNELELALIIAQVIIGAILLYHAYVNEASLVRQLVAKIS